MALFRRLRFRAKAALITVVFLVPILVFGLAFLHAVQEQIDRVQRERQGVATMQVLKPVLHGLLEARGTARMAQAGHDVSEGSRRARLRTEAALAALRRHVDAGGDPLQLRLQLDKLVAAWQLTAAAPSTAAGQGPQTPESANAAAQVLLRTVIDQSGLALDPDRDSFYIINGLFFVLPRLADDMGQVWGWGTYGVTKGALDGPAQYRQVSVWNARAGTGFDDLADAFALASRGDAALAAQLDLQGLLAARRFQQTGEPVDLVKAAATPEEVHADGARALEAVMGVYDRVLPVLDGLLMAREHRLQTSRAIRTALALGCLLLAFYLFSCFKRVLEQGLREVSHHLNLLAEGNLMHTPEVRGRDETAEMLACVARSRRALEGIVSEVRRAASGMVTASAEIAQGSGELSQRAAQTAAHLQEAASAVEEIEAAVARTAQRTEESARLARRNAEQAGQGGQVVQEVVGRMARIQEASRRVQDITGAIDGIAFQTNILALNAAVEAARAGEHGRGFAVVAGEVRALAQRAGSAAREITDLIVGNSALTAQGAQVGQRAGTMMRDVVSQADAIRLLLADVAEVAGQQRRGMGRIGDSVQILDAMTQQNSGLAEETAAAAQGLREQALALDRCVARFQLPTSLTPMK
jgi:methyl-accepting chemotaxis protein